MSKSKAWLLIFCYTITISGIIWTLFDQKYALSMCFTFSLFPVIMNKQFRNDIIAGLSK